MWVLITLVKVNRHQIAANKGLAQVRIVQIKPNEIVFNLQILPVNGCSPFVSLYMLTLVFHGQVENVVWGPGLHVAEKNQI